MEQKVIKTCVFVHYSTGHSLPYYVQIYINELSLYFDKVKVITNNHEISVENSSVNANISFEYFENRGYDFGMIYRYLKNSNISELSELALINDSNILINRLDKVFYEGRKSAADFWGIIDSNEKPWFSTHAENYHIQSHFIVLNKRAIKLLPSFFDQMNVTEIMDETDPKQLRRMVIDRWEIGLSQYLLSWELTSFSFIQAQKLKLKFKTKKHNLLFTHYLELAGEGYPLIKRKVISKSRKKHLFKKHISIENQLSEFIDSEWNVKKLFE